MSEPPTTEPDGALPAVDTAAPPPRRRPPVALIVLVVVTGAMVLWLLIDSIVSGRDEGVYESTRVALPATLSGLNRETPEQEAELAAAAQEQSSDLGDVSAGVYGTGQQQITVTAIRPGAALSAADQQEVLDGFEEGLEEQAGVELTFEDRDPGPLGGTLACVEISTALACVALDEGSVVIVAVLAGGDAGLDTVRSTRAAVVTRD